MYTDFGYHTGRGQGNGKTYFLLDLCGGADDFVCLYNAHGGCGMETDSTGQFADRAGEGEAESSGESAAVGNVSDSGRHWDLAAVRQKTVVRGYGT